MKNSFLINRYVDDLDLIEKNLRGLRDTMENRIYLDKIEETWIDLERMGWSEWTGRPVNILDAREAMVRDEMNRLVR
jgi:hypothetical protein